MCRCDYSVEQVGSGPSRVGRPRRESDLRGSHMILTSDVSGYQSPSIIVPRSLLDDLESTIIGMGSAKVQFGILAEFTKEDGVTKQWCLSNKAKIVGPEFLEDGIAELQEKLENYTKLSSGWHVSLILEVSMTVTKFSDIIHVSGSSYFEIPSKLNLVIAVVNVKNEDQYCFLYSVLACLHYDDINSHRERVSNYNLGELKFDPVWFPMKVANVKKFETLNPGLSINVLIYNADKNYIKAG